jgi:nucleoside-triphosphatase THEP1
MSNKVIILTGEIQTGKTTLLQQFCKARNDIAGILTPIVNEKRMFYDIWEKAFFEMEAAAEEEKLAIGKYLFSAAAFSKANNILLNAAKEKDIKYLVIDEIGPLEIKQQKGLYQSFNSILPLSFNFSLILVVRQSLVNETISTFNLHTADVMSIAAMKEYFESTP